MTHTTRTPWVRADLLHRRGLKVPALIQAGGLSQNLISEADAWTR